MYTEGFENLEEAESDSQRTYRSSSETDRLLRENEKLKKSLEKEKFFNKLLDQEIQDLKSSIPGNANYKSDYWNGKKRVSKSAFYTLLFITLVMAGYIGYGIYYDKKFDYLNIGENIPGARTNSTTGHAAPTPASEVTNVNEQPKTGAGSVPSASSASGNVTVTPPPAVNDSVPTIIGDKKASPIENQKQKAAVALTPDEEYNEEEVNATIREETKPVKRPSSIAAKSSPTPQQAETSSTEAKKQTETTAPVTAQPIENRPVIGKYRISSKANFYNAPDENTMRSTFISETGNKMVNALEEKNGFIYVEYTNDLGFTSKGWLSKTDLTKE